MQGSIQEGGAAIFGLGIEKTLPAFLPKMQKVAARQGYSAPLRSRGNSSNRWRAEEGTDVKRATKHDVQCRSRPTNQTNT
jgi:hypothetical protein